MSKRHRNSKKYFVTHSGIRCRSILGNSATSTTSYWSTPPSTSSSTSSPSSSCSFLVLFDDIVQRHVDFVHLRGHFAELSSCKRKRRVEIMGLQLPPRFQVDLWRRETRSKTMAAKGRLLIDRLSKLHWRALKAAVAWRHNYIKRLINFRQIVTIKGASSYTARLKREPFHSSSVYNCPLPFPIFFRRVPYAHFRGRS